MNLILLDSDELDVRLPRTDPRAAHIVNVLRRSVGDSFDVGSVSGRVGKAILEKLNSDRLRISVRWTHWSDELHPITLVVGMPRPQTARRLLRELTAMGAHRLFFCATDRSEPGYSQSTLWTSGEYERHLKTGAAQAFNPRLPELRLFDDLESVIDCIGTESDRIALDNYEAPNSLSDWMPSQNSVVLCLGAERGWSGVERDLLRGQGFGLFNLGSRVLRLETAATAGMALTLSRMRIL